MIHVYIWQKVTIRKNYVMICIIFIIYNKIKTHSVITVQKYNGKIMENSGKINT